MPYDLPEPEDIQGEDVPPVREYLTAKQKNGRDFCAEEIFKETWRWLKLHVAAYCRVSTDSEEQETLTTACDRLLIVARYGVRI